MDLRNNIFAAAFDELKRNHGIKTQKELARRMGVNENTITRILKGYTEVTEDIITKLQTASGCIFNLQWLRGEDPYHMLAEDVPKPEEQPQSTPSLPDPSSIMNAALSAQMQTIETQKQTIETQKQTIESLKRESASKDDLIADLRARIIEKDDYIATIKARIADLQQILAIQKNTDLGTYPFPVGVADDKKQRKNL